ncbi:Lysine biosynthesis regulatory protein LYS14 [Colletotrichum sidae]|uniref:Lysine biosynthesis regulatory protein LYS14 n=1 Tax=Colletotrichum sidae TaxID=1347389 RepID=A0A4R8T4Z8_9PEZI|nr:Lysine biosynthesis regulatory protein LYS14 [Colletotrichum sidae]
MAPQTRNHSPAVASSANGDDPGTPSAGGADVKLRRAHRKSRNGCKECKRRHVKCDETRHTCVNCATAERHCSYLDTLPASARSAVPAKRVLVSGGHSPATSASGVASNGFPVSAASPSITTVVNDFVMRTGETNEVVRPPDGQFFTLEHLHLFNHLLELAKGPLHTMSTDAAFSAPYLMDMLLAYAALHLAVTDPSKGDYYSLQATQLQTRGLMLFNEAKEEVSDDTCIPMFLFSATLGSQVLCSVFRDSRDDFNSFIDQFAWYLSIHRGVSAVTNRSWPIIRQSSAKELIDYLESMRPESSVVTELDTLHRMLDQADLGPASLEACRSAAEILQHSYGMYNSLSNSTHEQSSAVMAFGVRITTGFIDMLRQRRPEALVILAYYAVLVHRCRSFWAFGDAGEFMIRSISAHLGDYWSEWLAFPNSVLESCEPQDQQQQQQQHAG